MSGLFFSPETIGTSNLTNFILGGNPLLLSSP